MNTQKKNSILPLFITVFIDLLGLGIVIPILSRVLLDPMHGILPFDMVFSTRTLILGFMIACYPIAQFFGAPILGALSDRHGRKKTLIISLIGTLIGYILFAIGIMTQNIFLLFFSRTLDGFTGGNISIALSAIADMSDEKSKAKNFGLIGMAFGLGFIIGPYVGGKLSDPTIVSWFNFATPFWVAAILTFLNIIAVVIRFRETLKTKSNAKISPLTGFKNLYRAFQMPNLRVMFLVVFLLTFGFNFFTQFFQVFLIEKFNFSTSQIGDLFAFMGLWIAITQGGITRPLSKALSSKQILSYSVLLLAITFPFLLLPSQSWMIYLVIPFIAIFQGLTQPNSTAIISNLSTADSQGEILGINQSIQSLGQALPPIIAGFIVSLNINLPTIVAAAATGLAWIIFFFFFRTQKAQLSK
ncbi:MAG: MFS transporter [bacterium]